MARLFLSHAGPDKPAVRRIAEALRAAGHDPWLDEEEIHVGESIPAAVERGLRDADFVVMCLSRNAAERGWVEAERDATLMQQFRERKQRILPVRLEEVAPPHLIGALAYVDVFPEEGAFARGIERLGRSIKVHETSSARRSENAERTGTASASERTATTVPLRPSTTLRITSPTPVYPSPEVGALSEQLEHARDRRDNLRGAGVATDDVDREILELRRKLREGGQLRAGDALGDGRYLLIKPIGRGGFAIVWEAYDRTERRRVAIKVLHQHLAGDPQRRERFFRGARVMMDLKHPAVVRVYDPRGEDDAFCYFVMELVPGGNLRDAVLGKRVDAGHRLSVILQVGEALAEAHRRHLIHRDIKPANILLDENGNAKLTDFDLVGAHDTTGGTRTGALGTVVYAAPECLDKPQDATVRADVFGLGMTAIFCLSGQDLPMTTFRDPIATLAKLDCSVLVRAVIERAVAWEPEHRFPDAAALVDVLRKARDVGEHGSPYLHAPESLTQPVGLYTARATIPKVSVDMQLAPDANAGRRVRAGVYDVSSLRNHEPLDLRRHGQLVDKNACLVVIYGLELGKKLSLNRPQIIIGRSANAHIQIDQDAISRNHCEIINTGNAITLRDMGSTNGTYVNDERIDAYMLRDGDFIKVGRCILKFLSGKNIENAYHEAIYRQMTEDELTGIFNRRYFIQTLEREMSSARSDQRELSLMMVDVDRFRAVNDIFGHLAGDHVLKHLASLIKSCLQRENVLARYGGDEFAIALPGMSAYGVIQQAEGIRALVKGAEIKLKENTIRITVSIGVACLRSEIEDPLEFIKEAETELRAEKLRGRNR